MLPPLQADQGEEGVLADLLLALLLAALLDDLLVDVLLIVTVPAAHVKAMFDNVWNGNNNTQTTVLSLMMRQQVFEQVVFI